MPKNKERFFKSMDEILANYSPKFAALNGFHGEKLSKIDFKRTGISIAKKLTLEFERNISK